MEALQQESYLRKLHREHKERQARFNNITPPEPKTQPLIIAIEKRLLPEEKKKEPPARIHPWLRQVKFDGGASPLPVLLGFIAEYFGMVSADLRSPEKTK